MSRNETAAKNRVLIFPDDVSRITDLTGQQYGLLTVVSYAGALKKNQRGYRHFWHCSCKCGSDCIVEGGKLNSGHTKSCGCILSKHASENGRASRTHGEGDMSTVEYRAWCSMKRRCEATTGKNYKNYGSRGITVCDRWKDSFENFLADMGRRPADKTSLERKDNHKGYSPDNCVWADDFEQNRNRRNCK